MPSPQFSNNHDSGFVHPVSSEITPPVAYAQRRDWLKHMAAGAAGLSMAAWASRGAWAQTASEAVVRPGKLALLTGAVSRVSGSNTMEKITSYTDASTYNNFYEFGTDKSDPAKYAHTLPIKPWTVDIEGLVNKPGRLDLDALLKLSPMEERIYRMRCVEGWSMVIPWVGYSLSELIKQVQPLGSAKYIEFTSLADPKQMPGLNSRVLRWPYHEALRLDEARNPLTMLTFGMYGVVLPAQNGAPVRMVVPWKYGFKSAKSLVKIRFTEAQPTTSWSLAAPNEYGFYSNVNPNVDHPRWSQATERVLGVESLFAVRRKTELFNGYAELVSGLYAGLDLKKFY